MYKSCMKYISIIVGLLFSTILFAAQNRVEKIQTCHIGGGHVVLFLVEKHGPQGVKPYLKIDGKIEFAFHDFKDENLFIGDIILNRCMNKIFVFSMNYGPPYHKGLAIRFNLSSQKIERFIFSEKTAPQYSYAKTNEWLLLFPNAGVEFSQRYLLHSINDSDSTPPRLNDKMPPKKGWQVTKFYSRLKY